jgi:hypothetical protein
MRETFRDGVRAVRRSHFLILVFAVALLHGAATEGFDRLWTLHLLDGTSFPETGQLGLVIWFGAIEAVGLGLAFGAAEMLKRRADLADRAEATKVLAGIEVLLVAAVVVFGLAGFWLALGAFWIVSLLREVRAAYSRPGSTGARALDPRHRELDGRADGRDRSGRGRRRSAGPPSRGASRPPS